MKIGISAITSVGQKTGLDMYLQRLITGLSRIDGDNEYVVFVNRAAQGFLPPLPSNFAIVPVYTPPKVHYWWEQVCMTWLVPRFAGSVFHFPISAMPVLANTRAIVTIPDLTFRLFPDTMTRRARLYWDLFTRLGVRRAEYIIAFSESIKRDIQRHLGVCDDRIIVVYISASDEFKPILDASVLENVRYRYGLPPRFILFTGTIEPRKNLIRLLHAFQILKKRGLPHSLLLAGQQGWGFAEVCAAVSDLDIREHVIFGGYVPAEDLPLLYNAADLFVYPSLYEGFGLPVLEAMSCGTPVVASATSSLPEVAGDAALLVDPYDIEGWAEAIYRVLTDTALQQVLREKGLQRSCQFSVERMAKETIRVYQMVWQRTRTGYQ